MNLCSIQFLIRFKKLIQNVYSYVFFFYIYIFFFFLRKIPFLRIQLERTLQLHLYQLLPFGKLL